mmetsp:Transcript_21622/g.30308  ORF Transcript_21622/g.30308 Transcript_21622/m.30308 type:complete len:236 (-) Transcript_21622:174-881(-)
MLYLSVALLGLVSAAPAARTTAPKTGLRSMVRAAPRGLKRNVGAKSGYVGWNELDKMSGKVYDNIIFQKPQGWDPAGLSRDVDKAVINRYRDAELQHGRLGMMAVVGQILAEKFHPFNADAAGTAWQQYKHVLAENPSIVKIALAQAVIQELVRSSTFFDKEGLPKWHAAIGALKDGKEGGNYGFDPLSLMPKNADAAEKRKNQELNNGRLAMLAALGVLAEEAKTGVPVADKLF